MYNRIGQRLSASWIVSPLHMGDTRLPVASAQRLSASWIVSLGAKDNSSSAIVGAHACRRHGSFHKISSMSLTDPDVLNACRRHGSFHKRTGETARVHPLNAHAFGVSGSFHTIQTPSTFLRVQSHACRRHGSFHTRFVNALFTPVDAQTLSGMDRFTRRSRRLRRLPTWLNACRRHDRFNH